VLVLVLVLREGIHDEAVVLLIERKRKSMNIDIDKS